MLRWQLYALLLNNDAIYFGVSTDVPTRLLTHSAGRGSKYVRAHLPLKLLAQWGPFDRAEALRLEYWSKRQSTHQKRKQVSSCVTVDELRAWLAHN